MDIKIMLLISFVIFLQGCQSTNLIHQSEELEYSRIIDYTEKYQCKSEDTKCEVGEFYIYNHSTLVIEKESGENIFIFLSSGLVQYSDSFPAGKVFYYTHNISDYSQDDKKEKIENNQRIMQFIKDVNDAIK